MLAITAYYHTVLLSSKELDEKDKLVFKREPRKNSPFYRSLSFLSPYFDELTTPVHSEFASLTLQ